MKLINKNTGEMGELHYYSDKEYHFAVEAKDPTQTGIYKTLGELLQDWTDFIVHEPTEPLIKDGRIRKAVRAWAEANDIGVIKIMSEFKVRDVETPCEISFWHNTFVCELVGNSYTIEELCGEEEE